MVTGIRTVKNKIVNDKIVVNIHLTSPSTHRLENLKDRQMGKRDTQDILFMLEKQARLNFALLAFSCKLHIDDNHGNWR